MILSNIMWFTLIFVLIFIIIFENNFLDDQTWLILQAFCNNLLDLPSLLLWLAVYNGSKVLLLLDCKIK